MAGPDKTPWHLWGVGVLGLIWNGYGAADFAMSLIQGDAWYRVNRMTEAQIAAMHAYPAWMYVVWFGERYGGHARGDLRRLRLLPRVRLDHGQTGRAALKFVAL